MSEVVSEIFRNYYTILPHWRSARSSGFVEVTETFVSLKHCWWLGTVTFGALWHFCHAPASFQATSRQMTLMRHNLGIPGETFYSISLGVFKIASWCPFQRCVTRPSQSKYNVYWDNLRFLHWFKEKPLGLLKQNNVLRPWYTVKIVGRNVHPSVK